MKRIAETVLTRIGRFKLSLILWNIVCITRCCQKSSLCYAEDRLKHFENKYIYIYIYISNAVCVTRCCQKKLNLCHTETCLNWIKEKRVYIVAFMLNTLKADINPICYLLALLAHHFLHVSRIRVKSLTLRLLMSYIYIWHAYMMKSECVWRTTKST